MSNKFDLLPIRKIDIDLSVARSLFELNVQCNELRIRSSSPGAKATLRFNSTENVPVDIFNGRRFEKWPTTKLWLANEAQPGKTLTIEFWSVNGESRIRDDAVLMEQNEDFPLKISSDIDLSNTLSAHNALNNTSMFTIVPPATNVNGIKVYSIDMVSISPLMRIMYKATTPAGFDDGNACTLLMVSAGRHDHKEPMFIVPAGNGIYYNQTNTSWGRYSLIYEVL